MEGDFGFRDPSASQSIDEYYAILMQRSRALVTFNIPMLECTRLSTNKMDTVSNVDYIKTLFLQKDYAKIFK